jgi:hypothetical protein
MEAAAEPGAQGCLLDVRLLDTAQLSAIKRPVLLAAVHRVLSRGIGQEEDVRTEFQNYL